MKIIKPLIVLFLAAFTLNSCNNGDPDTVGPTTEITNITEGQEFKFGENLVMHFRFTDQTGMNRYEYEIYAKDYTPESFAPDKKYIEKEGHYTELSEFRAMLLPEKSATENYQEGEYLIEVTAADILGNISTYYKTINIVYPEDEAED